LNPHAQQSASFPALLASIWRNRQLIVQMSKREVMGRYSASMMGLTWSVLNPLMMLVVYTFVFSVVFKARWGTGEETRTQFALVLFTGLIVHGLLAEVLMRAPGVVVSNMNYVKKVVFPLEVLPVITMAGALFHGFVSVLVLLVANLLLNGVLHWTVVLLPLVLLPLVVLALGLAWILASIGVFVRDVGQVIGLLMTVLLFMSPVFYPTSTLPASLQPWMMLNPLTFIIEQARQVVIWGGLPDIKGWLVYMLIAVLVAWAGFFWFQRTRKGFADVL
jgi:lipopolysaccharide transport system permease protein